MLSSSVSGSSLGTALDCLPEAKREALGWAGWAFTSWGLVSAALQPIIELTLSVSWWLTERSARKPRMSQPSLSVKSQMSPFLEP